MKQARTQPLNLTYHQLSQLLYETLLILYTTEAEQDNKAAWQKADIVLSLYEHHIAKEEAVLSGILHEYEPCINTILLDDYKTIARQVASLRKMMTPAEKTACKEQKRQGDELLQQFSEFVNICQVQMKEHQSIINSVLWRYYSDEELKQMASAFTIPESIFTYSKTMAA